MKAIRRSDRAEFIVESVPATSNETFAVVGYGRQGVFLSGDPSATSSRLALTRLVRLSDYQVVSRIPVSSVLGTVALGYDGTGTDGSWRHILQIRDGAANRVRLESWNLDTLGVLAIGELQTPVASLDGHAPDGTFVVGTSDGVPFSANAYRAGSLRPVTG